MRANFYLLLLFGLLLSCGNPTQEQEFYDLEDYTTVPKADVHVHIRSERDAFVAKAREDNFKLVNIVVDGAGTWKNIREQFAFALFQQKAHPDQLRTITAFSVEDFHTDGWADRAIQWMDSCFAQGAIGVKVWKNIGMVLRDTNDTNVMLDDPRLDDVIGHIQQQDKLLFGHLGEPLNCWLPLEEMTTNNDRIYFEEHPQYHMYRYPELPSHQDQMQARNGRLDKHPGLRFVGAHMASLEWSVDTLAAWLDRYPQANVDLAARMGQVFYQTQQDREKVRNFFINYQDRILYATDMGDRGTAEAATLTEEMHDTWYRDWTYFVTDQTMESDLVNGTFQGIRLPKSAVDKIFYENAARVFGF